MTRSYDSSRRRKQAERTRSRILDAAVELHGRGITAYEPLARAAEVSLPTVRKHFPNRELLFQGCTSHFLESFDPPRLEAAGKVADPGQRVAFVAAEICRAHEETHGLLWHSFALADESPTLDATLKQFARLVQAAADVVVDNPRLETGADGREAMRLRVRALLDPLTYRAFRVHAGLDQEATRRELTALLTAAVGVNPPD